MAGSYTEDPGAGRAIETLIGEMLDRVLPACAKDAQRYAPVLTGYLRDHIGWERIGAVGGMVYADARHAAAVEAGYTHHRSGSHIAAQPYLRPAVMKNRPEL
jgi:hypothetical protein